MQSLRVYVYMYTSDEMPLSHGRKVMHKIVVRLEDVQNVCSFR